LDFLTIRGDQYRYAIERSGVTREFNDPRAQQLTGFDGPDAFGLPGNDDKPKSVIVDPTFDMPAFSEPTFNTMVIYELHIGTFNNTFAGAIAKLDYLQALGINAVEVLPITQNPAFPDHTPPDHDWGYDPVQFFAVKSKYGTPQDFKEFVRQCVSNVRLPVLNIGFPRGGPWHVRFNSGAKAYDPAFDNGDSFDTVANPPGKDGLNFNANLGIGPYSVVILSQ
jgi:1,4-alpha-glucan branching enzyme